MFIQTPSVSLQWTEVFLNELVKAYPDHERVVVWDGAGFHPASSAHPCVPAGVHVVRLPELNPIERLWDCVQDCTSNTIKNASEDAESKKCSY